MGFVETYHARAHILAPFFVISRIRDDLSLPPHFLKSPTPPMQRAIKTATRCRTRATIIRASIKSRLPQTRRRKGCQSQAQETLTATSSLTRKTRYISFSPTATQRKQLPEKPLPTRSKMAYMIPPRNPKSKTFQSKQARSITLEPANCFRSAGLSAP